MSAVTFYAGVDIDVIFAKLNFFILHANTPPITAVITKRERALFAAEPPRTFCDVLASISRPLISALLMLPAFIIYLYFSPRERRHEAYASAADADAILKDEAGVYASTPRHCYWPVSAARSMPRPPSTHYLASILFYTHDTPLIT